jgi:hypothetical protein
MGTKSDPKITIPKGKEEERPLPLGCAVSSSSSSFLPLE